VCEYAQTVEIETSRENYVGASGDGSTPRLENTMPVGKCDSCSKWSTALHKKRGAGKYCVKCWAAIKTPRKKRPAE